MNTRFTLITPPEVVYRISRSLDPCKLPTWEQLLAAERGRYDDSRDVFRVLYASTSAVGAVTEVLADLRPRYDRICEIAMIQDDGDEHDSVEWHLIEIARDAMRARLNFRYLSEIAIVDRSASFVDLGTGASRSHVEQRLGLQRLKIGDFTGRDRTISRSAARIIFDGRHAGLVAPSAEHPREQTVAIFETGYRSDELRARLKVISIVQPDSAHSAFRTAVDMLLERPKFSPLVLAEDIHESAYREARFDEVPPLSA